MKTAKTRAELEELLRDTDHTTLGFVPTMGALHPGHISLVERARRDNATVAVSIFVNPNQFNDPSDLKNYPRTPQADMDKLRQAGADILFMPQPEEIYPEPDSRIFELGQMGEVMEGATRPGHFNGVAQVVTRLFDLFQPARAYFGEKDFQQLAIIKSLVSSFNYRTEIIGCPTVREADGLAMSSRNELLEPRFRDQAPLIYKGLRLAAERAAAGVPIPETEKEITEFIESDSQLRVIYFNIVNANTLLPARGWHENGGIRGCIAVQAGSVRLIDNIRLI